MAEPPSTTITATAAATLDRRRISLNRLLSHRPLRLLLLLPNPFSFTSVISSAARSVDLTAGEVAHCQSIKRGFISNTHVSNCLIHVYAACGIVTSARQVFDEMCWRDVISWNSMVDGYLKVGDLGYAREVFDQMPERNVVSWNVMIGGYLKGRRTEAGLRLFRNMMMGGEKGDVKTMVEAVTGCGRLGRVREGRSVHGRVLRAFEEGEGNVICGTALVDMYGKCGRIGDARRVFDAMKGRRNLVCWNAMVLGCCVHGIPEEGIAFFEEMVREGSSSNIYPDEVTFVGVLSACARRGLLEEGMRYFEQMTNIYQLKPTFAHYWCMANLYGSVDRIQEAIEVLKSMREEKESLVWSGLLGYCRFRGDIELGERIAKALIKLEPFNGSRYNLLWNVYMAAGRWEEAQHVKNAMIERGIRTIPNGRLVDLNEIVHNFKAGDQTQPEIEKLYMMMDDFAVELKLQDVAPE